MNIMVIQYYYYNLFEENKYYPQTFLDKFFETRNDDNNINSLFKELVQIIDWSDDESNN